MFFKNVLVPYDESDHARSALHIAFGMVGDDPDATVHVISVVSFNAVSMPMLAGGAFDDSSIMASSVDYDSMMGAIVHRVRADIQNVVGDALDNAQCKIVTNAKVANSPVEGIAEYVSDHGIDLVVMGRRGLGALRGMLGSVSFGVLRSVDVPVLTVK